MDVAARAPRRRRAEEDVERHPVERADVLEVVEKVSSQTGREVELVSETKAKSHLQDTVMQVKKRKGISAPGIRLSKTQGKTAESGGNFLTTVWLNSSPSQNVSLLVSSSDLTEGTVSPSSLTFTSSNWETPRTFTVSGVDDSDADGHVSYQVEIDPSNSTDLTYKGLSSKKIALLNQDNDAGIKLFPKKGVTSESGKSTEFKLKLLVQPSSDVSVNLSVSDNTEASISKSNITFSSSNWNQAQTFTVTGLDDNVNDKAQPYKLKVGGFKSQDSKYSSLSYSEFNLINLDDGKDTEIPLDTNKPEGNLLINDGKKFLRSTKVSITITGTDDTGIIGYFLSENSNSPNINNSGWISTKPMPRLVLGGLKYDFSSGDGEKKLYLWLKDDVLMKAA